jgi:hypothetical protein
MRRKPRIVAFGGAGVFVLVGAVCAVLVAGVLGQILAFVLIALGLVGVTAMIFLEVGLSEDRARAREAPEPDARQPGARELHAREPDARHELARPAARTRLPRLRGEPRRIDR